MKKKILLAFLATTSLIYLSCEKNDTPELQNEQASDISKQIALEAAIEEAERVVDGSLFFGSSFLSSGTQVGKTNDDPTTFSTDCVSITSEKADQVTTIELTYSEEESCADEDGHNISGTLKISITDSAEDTKGIITYENLTVDGYKFNGTKSFDVLSSNGNGNPQVSLIIDLTVDADDRTITKKGSRLVEQTEGADTNTNEDDVFMITGSSTYSDTLGNTFAVEIVTPLVKTAGCKYISQGVKHYTNNGELSVLDYGDGTCDSVATLTKPDGSVVEIELKHHGKGAVDIG